MKLCEQQCPEIGPLLDAGVSTAMVAERMTEACFGHAPYCRGGGPDQTTGRCGLEPTLRMVARAIVQSTLYPLMSSSEAAINNVNQTIVDLATPKDKV